MKNAGKMLICAAGCVVLAVAVEAASIKSPPAVADKDAKPAAEPKVDPASLLSPDNPYAAIVERNVFDLHDPPPPPEKPPDKPPPSNVKLTGITTLLGKKKAWFIVNEPGAAGKQARTLNLVLSERERQGALEVLEINPKARTAKIKNDDIESVISIETNKAAGGLAPKVGMPGARGGPPPVAPPNFQRGGFNPGGGTTLPVRPMRTYNQYQNTTPPAPNYAAAAPQTQPAAPAMTTEENYTLLEAQKAQAQARGDPVAAIFPPTPLTMGLNQQNEAAQNEQNNTTAQQPTATPTPTPFGAKGTGTLSGGIK